MFATERHQKIRQMALEYKRVDVSRLSRFFSVSEVTIRKDLERLEKEGFLIRTHGGAVLNEGSSPVESYTEPINSAEIIRKQAIGSVVSQLIDNGDLIFLGEGTTCTEIARHLKVKLDLTVITNNISAAIELSANAGIMVITTGGALKRERNSFSLEGPSVLEFLSTKYVDKIIISPNGISFNSGFSMQNDLLAQIYRQVLNKPCQRIICADSDKFNKNAFLSFGKLTDSDIVVTDEAAPEEYLKFFFEHDIRVFNAYDIESMYK
ncbi:MAG: DeoR/GlpR family DNA-binding transcription regulator [Christensenella sp.]